MQTKKHTYFYISVLTIIVLFTAYEELFFRRYLFRKHIYIIADSLPNFLSSLLFIFAVVIIRKQHTNREILRSCVSIVAGLILYEVAQIWIPGRVFDFKDIIASLIGGVIAYSIIYGINKQVTA